MNAEVCDEIGGAIDTEAQLFEKIRLICEIDSLINKTDPSNPDLSAFTIIRDGFRLGLGSLIQNLRSGVAIAQARRDDCPCAEHILELTSAKALLHAALTTEAEAKRLGLLGGENV